MLSENQPFSEKISKMADFLIGFEDFFRTFAMKNKLRINKLVFCIRFTLPMQYENTWLWHIRA
jgi:hypothetical protein